MFPAALAAYLPLAMNFISGALDRESREDQSRQNIELQREFAQQGVRWRVEDAKAAGIHPLFALQGSGATFSPNPIVTGEFSQMGQSLERAFERSASGTDRELKQQQLALLKAQEAREYAHASYYDSEAARSRQNQVSAAAMPVDGAQTFPIQFQPDPHTSSLGAVEVEPHRITSPRLDDSSMSAGRPPFWTEYAMHDQPGRNRVMLTLPAGEDPAETLESISWWQWPLLVGENMRRYGWRWPIDALRGGADIPSRDAGESGTIGVPRSRTLKEPRNMRELEAREAEVMRSWPHRSWNRTQELRRRALIGGRWYE